MVLSVASLYVAIMVLLVSRGESSDDGLRLIMPSRAPTNKVERHLEVEPANKDVCGSFLFRRRQNEGASNLRIEGEPMQGADKGPKTHPKHS